MQAWKVAGLALLLAAAGGFGAAVLWFSRKWIAPPRVVFDPPHPERAEEVAFPSADGTPLAGWLLPASADAPVVVLCHGYQRCMEETFSLGVALRERGFTVLLFDFRGCGLSGGAYTTIGDLEVNDLLGAVRWLRARLGPDVPIGVHGISMGGAVAIRAAAESPEIAAVVADSAFAHLTGAIEHRFSTLRGLNLRLHRLTMRVAERLSGGRVARVRPVDDIARLAPRPVLLIHGTADGIVPRRHLDELYAAASEPKSLWALEGTTHAMARLDTPEEYVARVTAFFDAALRPERALAGVG